jgi:hypothetical protein
MLWKQKKKSYQLQSIPFQNPEIEEDIKFNEEELDVPKTTRLFKVEKILKGSLDSIPSHSPSMKIQIMGRRVRLRCKIKTLLGLANKLLNTKSLLTSPSNVLSYSLK